MCWRDLRSPGNAHPHVRADAGADRITECCTHTRTNGSANSFAMFERAFCSPGRLGRSYVLPLPNWQVSGQTLPMAMQDVPTRTNPAICRASEMFEQNKVLLTACSGSGPGSGSRGGSIANTSHGADSIFFQDAVHSSLPRPGIDVWYE